MRLKISEQHAAAFYCENLTRTVLALTGDTLVTLRSFRV